MNRSNRLFCMFVIVLLVVAALPFGALAQDEEEPTRTGIRPDAPPYGVRGPYPVGAMEFVIEDEERPLEGTMWYPAVNPEGAEEVVTYSEGLGDDFPPAFNNIPGHAILDATPDIASGPYPLVVFSHSFGSTYLATAYFQEHLASHGFVVLAVKHPGSWVGDRMMAQTEELQAAFQETFFTSVVTRPADVSRMIDYAETLAEAGGELEWSIDIDRIAAAGYSYGGYTALAAGGARLDFRALEEWCANDPPYVNPLIAQICGYFEEEGTLVERERQLIALAGVDLESGELWPSLGDPRIDALVTLAPGGAIYTNKLDGVEIPTIFMAGSGDTMNTLEYASLWAYENLGSLQKVMVVFEHANHFAFGNCSEALAALIFTWCSDSVWDMDRAHDLTNHFATAFLLSVLYDDAEAAAALAPDAVSFPGITYETTME